MKLSDGDALELENVGMELLLRKCPTHLNGKEEMASYLSVLYSVIHCGIAICSEAHILVSAGIYLPEGTPVTEELAELVADGQELISAENCPVYPVSNTRQPVCAFFPILREDREPLALLLCSRINEEYKYNLTHHPKERICPHRNPVPAPPSGRTGVDL